MNYDERECSRYLLHYSSAMNEYLRFASNEQYHPPTKPIMEQNLPDEIILSILSYLDVSSLKQVRGVNHRLYDLAARNDAGWRFHCEQLWRRKAHVCTEARRLMMACQSPSCYGSEQQQQRAAMQAYRISCRDGMFRHEITKEELCFDPITGEGTIWSFRFKKSAGPAWTSFDPWHQGREARQMVFLVDGTVKQYRQVKSSLGSNRDASKFLLQPNAQHYQLQQQQQRHSFELLPAFSDGPPSQHDFQPQNYHGAAAAAATAAGAIQRDVSHLEMKWRFITQPMDMPARPLGAYIRLSVGGREVPTYIVHRSPTMDWSFVLESLWAVYTSAPLPQRPCQEHVTGAAVSSTTTNTATTTTTAWSHERSEENHLRRHSIRRPRPARMRLRRTSLGGRWLNVADIESDSEEENDDQENVTSTTTTTNTNTNPASVVLSGSAQQQQQLPTAASTFLDDSVMTVTNRWQWREALLYNYGATTLPEGEGAEAEFDRVWNLSLRRAHQQQQHQDQHHHLVAAAVTANNEAWNNDRQFS